MVLKRRQTCTGDLEEIKGLDAVVGGGGDMRFETQCLCCEPCIVDRLLVTASLITRRL